MPTTKTVASVAYSNGQVVPEPTPMYGAFTYDRPAPRSDSPPVSLSKVRRIELPSGKWVDVRGGGKRQETNYLTWIIEHLQQANREFNTGVIDADQLHAAELSLNSGYAVWLGDRVVAHNLTDEDGEPLPLGFDLFWELHPNEAIELCFKITARESMFADPKAKTTSTTG